MKLQVIVGATRTGRITDRVAKWVANEAENIEGAEVEVIDLVEYPMPFFDEAISPQYNPNRQPSPEVKKWLDKVGEADAFVLVTPEYNRGTSAVLKNALDYLDFQFARKPVQLVGHGSSGGAQAIANLRMVLPGVQAVTMPQALYLTDRPNEVMDEQGNLSNDLEADPYGPQANLKKALATLKWYSDALAAARD